MDTQAKAWIKAILYYSGAISMIRSLSRNDSAMPGPSTLEENRAGFDPAEMEATLGGGKELAIMICGSC